MNAPPAAAQVAPSAVVPPRRWRTLAQAYDGGVDNFLLLRFVAAALVIFGHSYALCGKPNHGDFIARAGWGEGIYTGSVAVDIFFVVSGFLVAGSYVNRANLEIFLKSRALRILPAYAACMILTAFVLGAFFTKLSVHDYLLAPDTLNYVYVNLQFGTNLLWKLPGVFTHNVYPDAVNGSIWTLPAEVRMYLWIAILGVLGVLRKRWLANLVCAALLFVGVIAPDQLPLVPIPPFVPLAGFFLVGMFCYVNRDWIPLSSIILAVLAALAIVSHKTAFFPFAFGAAVGYFCLWFAYVPNFHFFNRFGDYSYGLYLWGFPIQQALASITGPTRPWLNFLISFPVVLALASGSWHWIEKPALRLKRRSTVDATTSAARTDRFSESLRRAFRIFMHKWKLSNPLATLPQPSISPRPRYDLILYCVLCIAVAFDGWKLLGDVVPGDTGLVQGDRVAQIASALLLLAIGWFTRRRDITPRVAFVIGALAGVMYFTRIYGFSLLDPTWLDWVLRGDWAGHYGGWAMYRHAPWSWPLGAIPSLMYPVGTSVVYTDSLPLLAMTLKPFASWLPEPFQYVGIWLAICCVLQGAFGALLIQRRTHSAAVVLVGAMLFLYAPIFLMRSMHITLISQWLLLAGLWLYFRPNPPRGLVSEAWPWWLAAAIAALDMPYLAMMLLAINGAYWCRRACVDHARSLEQATIAFASTVVLTLVLWWLSGAFIVPYQDGAGGVAYGVYSFNLLGFFNSSWFSRIVPVLPTGGTKQGEGFAYLGLGVIALLGVLTAEALLRRWRPVWPQRNWPLGMAAVALTAFAASTVLILGPWTLIDLPLSTPLLATFRSSGRFIWVPYYLILLWAIWSALKRWPAGVAAIVLTGVFAIQSWEFSLSHLYFAHLRTGVGWPPAEQPLADPRWDTLANGRHHLTLIPPASCGVQPGTYVPFLLVAAKHAMSLNIAYVSRWDVGANQQHCQKLVTELAHGDVGPDDLYVVADDWLERFEQAAKNADCEILDGLRACVIAPGSAEKQ